MIATVTEKHLDAAIAARGKSSLSSNCVAAQLCKEVYGTFRWCATASSAQQTVMIS